LSESDASVYPTRPRAGEAYDRRMITIRRVAPRRYAVTINCREPRIYLDHWAIRRISEDPARKGRFLGALKTKGTILFSLMNVVEIASDQEPARSAQIRGFLEQLGPYWMPVTIDPLRVLDAEETGVPPVDGFSPCVSSAFLADGDFMARAVASATLAHVVDLTRGTAGDKLRTDAELDTGRLQANIQEWRDERKKDKATIEKDLNKKYPKKPFDAAKPMRSIYPGLARLTITDGFNLDDNHMRDMYHACCAVRCADMVTLDGHWAGQVTKLKLPADFVKVYSEETLDQLLEDFEKWPTP
jgi:hypothetical protein